MVTVPADTPVTTPLLLPTVAVLVALLLQVPPVIESVNVTVDPWHTVDDPEIAAREELTEVISRTRLLLASQI